MAAEIRIEVAYATPEKQLIIALDTDDGTTVSQAIERSGIHDQFPGMEVDPARIGIFGRKATMEQVLRDGDRVESYRPRISDPKEARRKRAKKPL